MTTNDSRMTDNDLDDAIDRMASSVAAICFDPAALAAQAAALDVLLRYREDREKRERSRVEARP